MLVVLSPAKKLNISPTNIFVATEPVFSMNVKELIDITRTLNVEDLKNLIRKYNDRKLLWDSMEEYKDKSYEW